MHCIPDWQAGYTWFCRNDACCSDDVERVESPLNRYFFFKWTDIQGVYFIAEPNAILSRNIAAEIGRLCDQAAFAFRLTRNLVGERHILCSSSDFCAESCHQIAHRAAYCNISVCRCVLTGRVAVPSQFAGSSDHPATLRVVVADWITDAVRAAAVATHNSFFSRARWSLFWGGGIFPRSNLYCSTNTREDAPSPSNDAQQSSH